MAKNGKRRPRTVKRIDHPGIEFSEELERGVPTEEQQLFINEYIADPSNAREAVRRARPNGSMELSALDAQVNRWLANPVVAHAIAARMQEKENITKTSVQRTLHELAILGFSNIDWFEYDEDLGEWTLKEGVPEYAWRAVSEKIVEVSSRFNPVTKETITTRKAKLKFWNKNDALLTIAKHLGMITTRLANADGSNLLPLDAVRAIMADAAGVLPSKKE